MKFVLVKISPHPFVLVCVCGGKKSKCEFVALQQFFVALLTARGKKRPENATSRRKNLAKLMLALDTYTVLRTTTTVVHSTKGGDVHCRTLFSLSQGQDSRAVTKNRQS